MPQIARMCAIAVLAAMALGWSQQAASGSSEVGRSVIYLIPLNVETYAAVTRESVTSSAWMMANLSPEESAHLASILSNGKPAIFAAGHVRGMIKDAWGPVFLDSNGVAVRGNATRGIKIDLAAFDKFQASIPPDEITRFVKVPAPAGK